MRQCGARPPHTSTLARNGRGHRMTIADAWDSFLKRRVFTVGTLAFALDSSEPVKCDAVNEVAASLALIDLVTVLDEGAQKRLDSLGLVAGRPRLYERLEALEQANELADPAALNQVRKMRNDVAHQVKRLRIYELDEAISLVHAQLEAWGLVGARPNYIAFHDRSQWRKRPDGGDLPFERDFTIGVQKAETAEPVFAYDFIERRQNTDRYAPSARVERERQK